MSAQEMRKLMEMIDPQLQKIQDHNVAEQDDDYEDDSIEDEDKFDWESEMESGIVIQDNSRGGYDLTADGKYIGNYPEWDDVTLAARQWMEEVYYEGVFCNRSDIHVAC